MRLASSNLPKRRGCAGGLELSLHIVAPLYSYCAKTRPGTCSVSTVLGERQAFCKIRSRWGGRMKGPSPGGGRLDALRSSFGIRPPKLLAKDDHAFATFRALQAGLDAPACAEHNPDLFDRTRDILREGALERLFKVWKMGGLNIAACNEGTVAFCWCAERTGKNAIKKAIEGLRYDPAALFNTSRHMRTIHQ